MTREAIKVPLPDGNFKIVFREVNSNQKPEQRPEQKDQSVNASVNEPKSKDDKKKSRDPEKMRYYNPLNPGFLDILGTHLIGKPIVISLITGENIHCVMRGFAQYEILIEFDNRKVILLKQGILKIEVL